MSHERPRRRVVTTLTTPEEEAIEMGERIYHSRDYMKTLADAMSHPATSRLFDYMETWDEVKAVVMHTKTWKQIERHADSAHQWKEETERLQIEGAARTTKTYTCHVADMPPSHDRAETSRKMMILAIMDSMLHDREWRAKMTECMIEFMNGNAPSIPLLEEGSKPQGESKT